MTRHLLDHVKTSTLELIVVVCSSLLTAVMAHEAPPVEFPREGRELGRLEMFRQNLFREQLRFQDDERFAAGRPSDNMRQVPVGQYLHELREYENGGTAPTSQESEMGLK